MQKIYKNNIIAKNKFKFFWLLIYLVVAILFAQNLYKKQDLSYYTEIKITIDTTQFTFNIAMHNIFEEYFYDVENINLWKSLKKKNYSPDDELFNNFEKQIERKSETENWYKKNPKIKFRTKEKKKIIVIKNPTINYVNTIMDYVNFTLDQMVRDARNFKLKYLGVDYDQTEIGPMLMFMKATDPISKYRINYVSKSRFYVLSIVVFLILYVLSVIFVREVKDLLRLR